MLYIYKHIIIIIIIESLKKNTFIKISYIYA